MFRIGDELALLLVRSEGFVTAAAGFANVPNAAAQAVKTGAGDGMPPIESTGPAVLSAPVVTAPTAGQTVGPAVNVTGRTAGGATIRIITYVNMRVDDAEVSKIPGIVHNVPVDGTFDFRIALPSVRGHELDELYYDIHVWMVDGGEQSDPTIVRVYRD